MKTERIYVIFNPASAGGKTLKKKDQILIELKTHLGNNFVLKETHYKNEAMEISQLALYDGCDTIIAVGGDGTINEVVNGFFENGKLISPDCKLGIISSGTGQGFAQSLGLPDSITEQIKIINQGFSRKVDLGKIIIKNSNHDKVKYFANEFQAGIGGNVVKNASINSKYRLGFLTYGIGALKVAMKYNPNPFELIVNDYKTYSDELLGIVISNGNKTGGGMKLTPDAKLDDNLLDLLLIHSQSRIQRLINFQKIYGGEHIKSKSFSYTQVLSVSLDLDASILVEADGEVLSSTPSRIEIVPSALTVFSNYPKD